MVSDEWMVVEKRRCWEKRSCARREGDCGVVILSFVTVWVCECEVGLDARSWFCVIDVCGRDDPIQHPQRAWQTRKVELYHPVDIVLRTAYMHYFLQLVLQGFFFTSSAVRLTPMRTTEIEGFVESLLVLCLRPT
jgi:hypothetical protein